MSLESCTFARSATTTLAAGNKFDKESAQRILESTKKESIKLRKQQIDKYEANALGKINGNIQGLSQGFAQGSLYSVNMRTVAKLMDLQDVVGGNFDDIKSKADNIDIEKDKDAFSLLLEAASALIEQTIGTISNIMNLHRTMSNVAQKVDSANNKNIVSKAPKENINVLDILDKGYEAFDLTKLSEGNQILNTAFSKMSTFGRNNDFTEKNEITKQAASDIKDLDANDILKKDILKEEADKRSEKTESLKLEIAQVKTKLQDSKKTREDKKIENDENQNELNLRLQSLQAKLDINKEIQEEFEKIAEEKSV